jgi:NAD kinase
MPPYLSNRPIAMSSDAAIEVLMHKSADAYVHIDSHSHFELMPGDRICIRRYPRRYPAAAPGRAQLLSHAARAPLEQTL